MRMASSGFSPASVTAWKSEPSILPATPASSVVDGIVWIFDSNSEPLALPAFPALLGPLARPLGPPGEIEEDVVLIDPVVDFAQLAENRAPDLSADFLRARGENRKPAARPRPRA